uniref:RNA-binding protein NOB1-like n=1 Tax=Ciona intestinalis TaxID=7719 RepID=UPI000180CB67|nr:RNA-binding protein NOB1-like [Ciona intestinalis]|eukprot:XP_026692397.1 RNA-binding protein NOB1-like [Ciona intestinalis]
MIEHLVVDSGAFLKNADLRSLGENIYTCQEVIAEIKDKATKQRLSVLGYELKFKQPSPKSILCVTEASKKTGDYTSLSHTDILVLALTYELTCLHEGCEKVKQPEPVRGVIQMGNSLKQDIQLPGFYLPKNKDSSDVEPNYNISEEIQSLKDLETKVTKEIEILDLDKDENDTSDLHDEENEEESDEEGWITPSTLREMKDLQEDKDEGVKKDVKVGCITTDFAMQNVLLQMKMHVVAVDGLLVKTVRSYVLRCHACFNITKIMTKVFCPKCGNKTLKRVPVEVQPDGTLKLFFSRNPKVLNPRGLRYSLPMPQGGKHSNNPMLCEDQVFPHDRPSKKALQNTNVWKDDYDCSVSPFAENEITSRAFRLGIRTGGNNRGRKSNPNAVGRKFVKSRR